ncbi:MAG: hypothetical protein WA323_10775 [Candidatus Nitrosopolaris sp.]
MNIWTEEWHMDAATLAVLPLVFIAISTIMISHNYFATAILAYSKLNQVNSIYNIPLKKVHVGDIDVAYKIFGKGNNTIILINGAGENICDKLKQGICLSPFSILNHENSYKDAKHLWFGDYRFRKSATALIQAHLVLLAYILVQILRYSRIE